MAKLDGQSVIVTGASSGIGEAGARMLAREGAAVALVARRKARLDNLKQEIEGAGGRALAIEADITSEEDRKRIVAETVNAFGRIDALINNAGYGQRGPIEMVPVQAIRQNFETNLFSLIALTQLVIPIMRKQGSGRIVNISSVAGRIGSPLSSVYDATKHALEAVSDGLRGELDPFGIKVVIIEPGFITTEFLGVANEVSRDVIEQDSPYAASIARRNESMQRLRKLAGTPDDIAELIVKALAVANPRARYSAPRHAQILILLRRFLPERLFDYINKQTANAGQKRKADLRATS
ncbi:MAG TPA: SDR family NAD(P)-dependent oxidoreductase [Blastocatellia bacterium]|nr:SDR family NAD(P)-dependent oxidoreductase [Blastocatellia bacterium]